MESRDSRRWVSKQINLDWFQLGCLQTWRTHRFIGKNFVTVRSKRSTVTINGPWWTVFGNIVIVGLWMEGSDAPVDRRYKNAWIPFVGSRSNGPDVIRHRYIRTVITPPICARVWWSPVVHAPIWSTCVNRSLGAIQRSPSRHVTCIK